MTNDTQEAAGPGSTLKHIILGGVAGVVLSAAGVVVAMVGLMPGEATPGTLLFAVALVSAMASFQVRH